MTTRAQRQKVEKRGQQVLSFVRTYIQENDGRSPTLRELCAGTGISSTSVAVYWIDQLEASGQLTRVAGQARSLRLVEPVPRSSRRKQSKGGLVLHCVANRTAGTADGEYRHRIRVEYVRADQGGLNVRAFSGAGATPEEAIQRASAELTKWLGREVGE